MRKREVLDLLWEQVDLRNGTIALAPQDTKSEAPRLVMLTARLAGALKALPRGIGAAPVFPNPKTGQPWAELRRPFRKAVRKAGLQGLWFHDLRRSFVTRARKAGIPESVVMRMYGHKTRAVFDRYNVVDESDLRIAARTLENHGRVLDTVTPSEQPRRVTLGRASGFRSCGGPLFGLPRTTFRALVSSSRGSVTVRVLRPKRAA